MLAANQLKNGICIKLEDVLYLIIGYQHVKPGKGPAFVRIKIRDLATGRVLDRTLRTEERVQDVFLERKPIQFMYEDSHGFHFMDQDTYDQVCLQENQISDVKYYLKDDIKISAVVCDGKIVSIEPPVFVELKVTHTDPGLKGDTVSSSTKPAELETGLTIQVPLFVDIDDVIKVDTRTNQYVERVK